MILLMKNIYLKDNRPDVRQKNMIIEYINELKNQKNKSKIEKPRFDYLYFDITHYNYYFLNQDAIFKPFISRTSKSAADQDKNLKAST